MTTAVIEIGNVCSRIARILVQGGEPVGLAARDESGADSLAAELGALASSASVVDAVSQADAVLLAVWLDTGKELISHLSQALVGKVVIDPPNPIVPDGHGGFTTTLPEGESAARSWQICSCRCALREGFRQAGGRRAGFGGQPAIRAGSSVLRNRRRRGGRNGGEAHHCRWL